MVQLRRMPSPGDVVDARFRLEQEIGRGSVGVVFEAEDLDSGDWVALKILRPRIISEHNGVERFEREAKLASRLNSSHSIQIHGYGFHDRVEGDDGWVGLPYIIMERLHGVDLQAYLDRRGALSIGETVGILLQAAQSLAEAHKQGIVHRDLKPGNVFLCNMDSGAPEVKVLDYGVAKLVGGGGSGKGSGRLTADGMICGTPQYMAPEQALGKPLTPAVDVYAM
ncbi:MAG: serine/threonine-protein kinase, partial [Myxococcota bacterium]